MNSVDRLEIKMLSEQAIQLAVLGLAALSVGLVVYVLVFPYLSGEKKADKRRESIARQGPRYGNRGSVQDEHNQRRKQVQDTLKELEKKQKAKNSITIRMRILRTGLNVSPKQFYMTSLIAGLGVGAIALFSGLMPAIAGALAIVFALGAPRWVLNFLGKRRQKKFLAEFANAIDVVVRGVKTGLPLNECLEIIAVESPEPIKSEFAELVEQQRVGVPIGECFDRMFARVPLPEISFFAIVVAIQQQAGGSLAEALGNLSGVLRARKQLAAKVKALSAEANMSAMILAALPFVVMTMVYLTAPDYISLLWEDPTGHMLLAAGGVWMTIGMLVMMKMINFKY